MCAGGWMLKGRRHKGAMMSKKEKAAPQNGTTPSHSTGMLTTKSSAQRRYHARVELACIHLLVERQRGHNDGFQPFTVGYGWTT